MNYGLDTHHQSNISYYIKRDDDIGKFDPRSDEGMFLGYSLKSKAYRCFNYRTKTIV